MTLTPDRRSLLRHPTSLVAVAMAVLLVVAAPAFGAGDDENVFAGKIYQAIAALLTFLLVLFVLMKYAWGPILQGLADRENKIKSDLEEAEQARQEAKAALAEQQAQLKEVQIEAQKVVQTARADAEKVAAQLRREAETEIGNLRKQAQSDIRAAKEQALSEIYAKAADLSTLVASQIIRRDMSSDDVKTLVDNSLSALGQSQNPN